MSEEKTIPLEFKKHVTNPAHPKYHRYWVMTWVTICIAAFFVGILVSGTYHAREANKITQEIIDEITCPGCNPEMLDYIQGISEGDFKINMGGFKDG